MDSEREECWFRFLIGSLAAVAADPDKQLAWLDTHRFDIDELALDFECAAGLVQSLVDADRVAPEIAEWVQRIDATFDQMSGPGNAERWSVAALAADPGWIEVRGLARRCLVGLIGHPHAPMPVVTPAIR